MYGRHVTRNVRGFQRTYEERASEYRRHIEDLSRERQRYQDMLQKLQPTLDDDEQLLSHLDATIRSNITELQQFNNDYDQAVDDWRQLAAQCEIAEHRDSHDWARSIDLLEGVGELAARFNPVHRAGFELEAPTPPESPAAAEDLAAAVSEHASRSSSSEPAPLAAEEEENNNPVEQRSDSALLAADDQSSSAQASRSPHRLHRVTIDDNPQRHFYAEQSDASSSDRYSLITVDAYTAPLRSPAAHQLPTPFHGVPIVQQLDHGDGTTPSTSPQPQDDEELYAEDLYDEEEYETSAVMTYTDGNVAAERPFAWHCSEIGTSAHVTANGLDPFAPLATGVEHMSIRPPRTSTLPPASRLTAPVTRHSMRPRVPTASERGAFSFFSSGSTAVDASGRLPIATTSSGPLGPPAPAPTTEARSDRESASAFYRNATFHRDDKTSSQMPLVLKEIPVTPFDGDIRKYPTFRNRFLDIVEGHPDLFPRHKLQYLLQFLRGEPYDLANNYQITDENYYEVTDLLEERYGNKDMIRNLLMADLIAIRPASQAVPDLRRFHGDALRVTTELKQLGDDVDSNRLYEQTLMSKLPHDVKLDLIRNSDYVEAKTASSILKGLNRYVQLLETSAPTGILFSNMAMGSACPSGRRTPSRPSSPRYASKANHAPHSGYGAEAAHEQEADPRQKRQTCAFCSLSHWAPQCTIYRTRSQRYVRAKKLGLCFLCLRGNHWIEKCPQRTLEPCRYCSRRTPHHRALCKTAPSRTWKSPRSSPVSNQDLGARKAPGGSPGGDQSAERHVPAKKAVSWNDSRLESTARIVPPSAQLPSGEGNSKKISRKRKSRNPGTGPQGRTSTSRPTTTSTVEDMPKEGVNACDIDRRLAKIESLLTTARCPPNIDAPQYDRPNAGPSDSGDDEDPWSDILPEEDVSMPESFGHCSDAPTVPSDAYPDDYEWFQPPHEDHAAYAVSASLPADTQTVLLECAKVTAVNPANGASREVTAFFDSGSNVSYVSTALATDLGLPQQERRRLRVNTFGSRKPLLMEGFKTSLVLHSRRGRSVSLDATAAPDCIVKAVTTALVEDHELPSLMKNEVTMISTQETPDILIGCQMTKSNSSGVRPRSGYRTASTSSRLSSDR